MADATPQPAADLALTGRRAEALQVDRAHQQLIAELREANRRQEELARLRRNMLNALAHEMRTPLTVILGFADLLTEGIDGELSEGQREAVTAIRDAALREAQMLDDALALARARSEPGHVELMRLDLRRIVDAAVGPARQAAREKGLELLYQPAESPLPVDAEPAQLRRAVDHLLGNAVKFTPRGTVSVAVHDGSGSAILEVRDTGIGIAESDLEAIFDEFLQLEQGSTRRFGGVGLGLALVRTLVEAHHGEVHVTSEPEKGSHFTVTLPLAK